MQLVVVKPVDKICSYSNPEMYFASRMNCKLIWCFIAAS